MEKNKTVQFFEAAFYVFAFFCICAYLLPKAVKIILPFAVAYLISFIIVPASDALHKRCRIPKRIAVVVLMLLIISSLILIIFNLIYQAVFAMQGISQTLPDFFSGNIPEWANGIYNYYLNLPTSKQIFIDEIFMNFKNNISEIIKNTASFALGSAKHIAGAVPNMFVFTAVVILATYFICVDRVKIEGMILKLLPNSCKEYLKVTHVCLKKALGEYITAQLILMLVSFLILLVAFLIIKVKYSFLLAMLTAFVDALPILGSGTILIPWAAIRLLSGNYIMAGYIFAIYLIVMLVRQLLEPKVLGSRLGINPLVTLFAMFLGFKTIGFFGLAIGPVAALIICEIIKNKISQKTNE